MIYPSIEHSNFAMNTKLTLSYRDAANYKTALQVVLRGAITQEQVQCLVEKLDEGQFLIAAQVGLPTPSENFRGKDGWPNDELDHPYTQVFEAQELAQNLHTSDEPTIDLSVDELVKRVCAVQGWDEDAEWTRLNDLSRPKSILLSLSIRDSSLSPEQIVEAVRALGGAVTVKYEAEFEERPAPELSQPGVREIVLMATSDETEPLFVVSDLGEDEGRTINPKLLDELQRQAVCVDFYGKHPDAAKYGAPMYTVHDDYAMAEVGALGFASAPSMGVNFEDTGDDSTGCTWLRLRYVAPPQVAREAA